MNNSVDNNNFIQKCIDKEIQLLEQREDGSNYVTVIKNEASSQEKILFSLSIKNIELKIANETANQQVELNDFNTSIQAFEKTNLLSLHLFSQCLAKIEELPEFKNLMNILEYLKTTHIPFDQMLYFNVESYDILILVLEKLKESNCWLKLRINEYTPIYHDKKEELIPHELEIFMYNFNNLNEKTIEALVNVSESFVNIQKDYKTAKLKTHNLYKFFEYIAISLLTTKIDFNQGSMLKKLKHNINFSENEISQLNISDDQLKSAFKQLHIVISFKETQLSVFYNCMENLETGFKILKNKIEQDIKAINFLKKHMRIETLKLASQTFNHERESDSYIDTLLADKYIDDDLKRIVRATLRELVEYSKCERNQEYKLKVFFKQQKERVHIKLDDLSRKIVECNNLIKILFKYLNANTSPIQIPANQILELSKHIDKYELNLCLNENQEKNQMPCLCYDGIKRKYLIYFKENVFYEPTDQAIIQKEFSLDDTRTKVYLADNHKLLREIQKIGFKLDSALDLLMRHLTNLCDRFRIQKIKKETVDENIVIEKSEHTKRVENYLEELKLNKESFKPQLVFKNNDIDSVEADNVKHGKFIIVIRRPSQFDIVYKNRIDNQVSVFILTENDKKVFDLLKTGDETNKDIHNSVYDIVSTHSGFANIDDQELKLYQNDVETTLEKLDLLSKENTLPENGYNQFKTRVENVYVKFSCEKWSDKVKFLFDDMNFLMQIKIIAKTDIDLKDICETLNKISDSQNSNLVESMYGTIEFYQNLYENIKQRDLAEKIEDSSFVIDEKLKQLQNDQSKYILVKALILNRLLVFNNNLYRKYARRKCQESIILKLDLKSMKPMNIESDIDYSLYFYYEIIKKLKRAVDSVFIKIDNFFEQRYYRVDFVEKIQIYKYLIELSSKLDVRFNIITKSSLNEAAKNVESIVSSIKFFYEQCLLKISGLLDLDIKNKIGIMIEKLLELKPSKCDIRLVENFKEGQMYLLNEIVIEKEDNKFSINYLNEKHNKTKIYIDNTAAEHELLTSKIYQNALISENQRDQFKCIYDLVEKNEGNINKINQFEEEIEKIFRHFVDTISSYSEKECVQILDGFKTLLEASNIYSYDILTNFKGSIKLVNSESESIREYIKFIDEIIDEQVESLIQSVQAECSELMNSIEYKNKILNYVARMKAGAKLCEKDELKELVISIGNFLNSGFINSSYDVLIEYKNFCSYLKLSPIKCLQLMRKLYESLKVYVRLFKIRDDCPVNVKQLLTQHNEKLRNGTVVDPKSLLKILKEIKHMEGKPYATALMTKLVFNFVVFKFDNIEILRQLEEEIVSIEIKSVRNQYYKYIKAALRCNLTTKLDEIRKEEDKIECDKNELIKKILDVFWKNIEFSDLLNKQREKVYLNICLQKINILKKNSIEIFNLILDRLENFQKNPNKTEFTKNVHSMMNDMINKELEENVEYRLRNISLNPPNFANADDIHNLDKLALLLSLTINNLQNDSVKIVEFITSFINVFKYFSWRQIDLSTEEKEKIEKSFERINSAIDSVKNVQELDQLKMLVFLRANDNLLQEELNMLNNYKSSKVVYLARFVETHLEAIERFKEKVGVFLVPQVKNVLSQLSLDKKDEELQSLLKTIMIEVSTEIVINQDYSYSFDDMNCIMKSRMSGLQVKCAKPIKHLDAMNLSDLNKYFEQTKLRKKEEIVLIPCKTHTKWVVIVYETDNDGNLTRLECIDLFSQNFYQTEALLRSSVPSKYQDKLIITRSIKQANSNANTGPLVVEILINLMGIVDTNIDLHDLEDIRLVHLNTLKKSNLAYYLQFLQKQKQNVVKPVEVESSNEIVNVKVIVDDVKNMLQFDAKNLTSKDILQKISELNRLSKTNYENIGDWDSQMKFIDEITNLKTSLVDKYFEVFLQELKQDVVDERQKNRIRKILIENDPEDWQTELTELTLDIFTEEVLDHCHFKYETFDNHLIEIGNSLHEYQEYQKFAINFLSSIF